MTAKEIFKKLSQEKFDQRNLPVYVVVEGERYEIENVDLFDDGVHFTIGAPAMVQLAEVIGENMEAIR